MAFVDYYKILNIDKNASDKEIKKAYRKLARKYHPDLNTNDKTAEKKFKEINEANEVLSNPEKRKKYDSYGENWQHGEEYEKARQQQGQRRSNQKHSSQYTDGTFSDFFESMFGDGTSSYNRRDLKYRGEDFNAELQLSLSDVYQTHKRTLNINGKNIRLNIPAGVENGQTIKIKGHGGKGINGGPDGSLFIKFLILNTTKFRRDHDNLHVVVAIDLYKAMLGGEITVDTFDGKVKLKIKPETTNGTKVKLKGKGFPRYKKENQYGDLFITYQIEIPEKLTNREKELFRELAKLR